MARVTVSPRPNRFGLRVDAGAVRAAVELLGLKEDVLVKWANGTRRWGSHRWHYGDRRHSITLSTNSLRNVLDLSETLWHELQHAVQTERLGPKEYWASYKRHGRSGHAYRVNPFEIEANNVGAANGLARPLGFGAYAFNRNRFMGRPDWYTPNSKEGTMPTKTKAAKPKAAAPTKAKTKALDAAELLRRAKNSLASTKSYLKKAEAAGDAAKVEKLRAKLAADEERVARYAAEVAAA